MKRLLTLAVGIIAAAVLAFGQQGPAATGFSEPDLGWLFLGNGPYTLKTTVEASPGSASFCLVKDTSLMSPNPEIVYSCDTEVGEGGSLNVPLGALEPGFYQVRLRDTLRWNIGVRPDEVLSPVDAKPDFDAFWEKTFAQLDSIPLKADWKELPEYSNGQRTCYEVRYESFGGAVSGGIISIPNAPGTYPVRLWYMGYGAQPIYFHPASSPGVIDFQISVRDQGIFADGKGKWIHRGLDSKENFYFRGAFCDVKRAIDFVATLEKADMSRMVALGDSQGGALSSIAAAVDPRIAALMIGAPFLGDYPDYHKIARWPWADFFDVADKEGIPREEVLDMLTYFDVKNFAPRITCPVLMFVGLQDRTCPPHTNFAIYNNLGTSDRHFVCLPRNGHDVWKTDVYRRRSSAFLSRFLAPAATDGTVIQSVKKIMEKGVTAVCVEGPYLYAGGMGSITVLDITDPRNPREAGRVDFPGAARQMVPYDGKLFVSARETGVWIFDISHPKAPKLISRYDGIELSTGIDAAGEAIFVGERMTGVEFVDGRDPRKAEHIRVIKTPESQTVFYSNGYLYSGEWYAGRVTIFDARDLSDIRLVKEIYLQGFGDGLWVSGNRLYASTGHHHRNHAPNLESGDGHGVEIWDVSHPEEPVFISRCEFDNFYISGIDYWLPRPSGDGRALYCGDVFNGLYVVDISDEFHPQIIHHWKPAPKHAVTSLALADGVAYVAVSDEGLYAMESDRCKPSPRDRGVLPKNPDARFSYPTPEDSHFTAWLPDRRGAVKSAAVYKDALFVGCGDAGLYTVKLDASGKPVTYRHLDIPFAGGVAVKDDLLFVSQGQAGLGVYRIGARLQLKPVGLIKEGLNPDKPSDHFSYWVSVPNDRYVVNSSRTGGYQFLALGGTSRRPTLAFRGQFSLNLNYNRYISERACPDGKLPYATRSGLVWIDLSDGTQVDAPVVFDGLKNSLTEGCTLFKDGNVLLARHTMDKTPYEHFLATVRPGEGEFVQCSNTGSAFNGIPRWESGDNVLICNFVQRSVSKIDAADLSDCKVLFQEATVGYPEPGLFWKGKCVVPCGFQGLLIEK